MTISIISEIKIAKNLLVVSICATINKSSLILNSTSGSRCPVKQITIFKINDIPRGAIQSILFKILLLFFLKYNTKEIRIGINEVNNDNTYINTSS